ncbi:receptor-type tyrosine-protein phosphatase kappa [Anabrus simplex]|uniref:receptor-type tyrosine-protein phosphatase kappa n=1 Tax=Anabrus simplex TaxID=316456 RepID=UPI0035A3B00C
MPGECYLRSCVLPTMKYRGGSAMAAGQCPAQEFRYKIIRSLDHTHRNGSLTHNVTTIKNLLPYNNYSIEIIHNKLLIFNTTFATKEAAPSKVQNLTVVAVTATYASIAWKKPESPNGIIKNYAVAYKHESYLACQRMKRDETKSRGRMNTTQESIEIIKLLPFSDYSIEVWAITTENGAIETIRFSTKSEDIPTETPSLLEQVKTGPTWVTFNLDVPRDCTKIKGPLENTTVIISGNSSWNENYMVKNEFNTNSIHLTHLIPYSSYGVTVYYNRSGNINHSLPFWFHVLTQASGPPAVKDFTAFSHGPGWISLRWIPPYPPYGILEKYELNWLYKTEIIHKTNTCSIWPGYVCATIFQNIKKNTRYTVKVVAINKNSLYGKTEEVTVTTVEEASSSPLNLKTVPTNSSEIILTWQHPWLPRGRLQSFIIETKLISSLLLYIDPNKNTTRKEQLIIEKETLNYNFTVGDLIPSSSYIVELYAKSSIKGNSTYTTINTPAVKPYFNESIVVEEQEVTDHTLTIILPPAPLYWTTNSTSFVVVTLLDGAEPKTEDQAILVNEKLHKEIMKEIENYSGKMSWIAAELQLTPSPEKFIVGQSQQYSGLQPTSKFGNHYNNHPLSPRSTYQVHVVAVSLMPTASVFGLVSLAQAVRTKDAPSASSALLALLLLLVIPILGYLVYVRLYKRRKNSKVNGMPLLQHQQELKPMNVQYKPDKTLPTFPIIPQQRPGSGAVEFVQQTSRRIPVSMLEQYVRSALVTGEFQSQYAMVPHGLMKPCEIGSLPENKPKNRYRGLIPYDATRVVLKKLDQDEFSDYINANFIVGYRYQKFYIAAQGPKANTIADFWQMIWQEEVKIIAMLTNIVESGKRKCEKYWPDLENGMTYGAFTINTISTDVFPDYTISRLQVTFKGENRLIDHLHFTSWPDHGVPLYPLSLARYLKKMLTIEKGPGPILVHCSAGVGRTGTVILADISLRMAAEEGAVDVLYFLQKIREHRLNLVDNIEQYTFLHLVLLECLIEESMEIPCDGNFKTQVQTLRDNGGLVRQFLYITRKKEIGGTHDKDIVQRSPHHNRDKSVVSGQGGDLIVMQPFMNNVSSTYMSPVYVDGFRVKNQFISTQFPVKKTLADFWCLVLEKRIPLIIVLNELDFHDKSTVEFRPSTSKSLSPTPSIEVKQYNLNKQDKWNHHFLEISDNSKDHPREEKVQLLEFKGWHSEESIPSSTNSLLMLWKETETVYTGKGPILVICRDGVTACGLFLTLTFLIEKVKLEKVCDVYHAVKTICQSRTEFMDRQDQFEYLYDAVIAYLEDVQIYANFQ